MKKVVIVAGTRPEVIKMAPVYFALEKAEEFKPVFLSTGQHREMLDQAFRAFGIVPEYDLELMRPGQHLTGLTARVIEATGKFLEEEKPDAMLVQGDTASVLAASMAGFFARVPVGHVEAGLRTYNYEAPWPEEMNRRMTAPICKWNFAPTEGSRQNLLQEFIPKEQCYVTGNTVIDALLWMRDKLQKQGVGAKEVAARLKVPAPFCDKYLEGSERWILITGHRRESFGGGFEEICQSILRLAEEHPDLGLLYPVHLNPQVREPVDRLLGGHERIALVEPAGYEDFIWLMDRCYFVLSDSGGVQEEAPGLGKPVLVMRETTERPEGVEGGTCRLVGTDSELISQEAKILLEDSKEYKRRSTLANPYGDGHAAERIREILAKGLP